MLRTLFRLSLLSRKSFCEQNFKRNLKISKRLFAEEKVPQFRAVLVKDPFENIPNKNKKTYVEMIKIYVNRNEVYRSNHVEFIYSALKNMEEFGVNRDLDVYKALIDVLPKGKVILSFG